MRATTATTTTDQSSEAKAYRARLTARIGRRRELAIKISDRIQHLRFHHPDQSVERLLDRLARVTFSTRRKA